jgi:N6-L-threonylcarbamoyladenine synthase
VNVLGIETSCDDTSFALFSTDKGVVCNLTANQLIHDRYGGVVPEIASREHAKNLLPVFDALLDRGRIAPTDIGGIGVTNGPGLIGSLLVGVGFAKSLALALGCPVVGVHHIEAHILSNELAGEELQTPSLVLVVSGGHTALYRVEGMGDYKLVGNTRDDAAGECFDKIAKLLGLGFPGGPAIERRAREGDAHAIRFPRAMMTQGSPDFSFSGLKTAVRLHVEGHGALGEQDVADIAASAQEAIVDVLVQKTIACAKSCGARHIYLAGGVAANGQLRDRMGQACSETGIAYHAPLLEYCTDNGAMVARTAVHHLANGRDDGRSLDVFARGPVESWPLSS